MNCGLLKKSWREAWLITFLFGTGLLVFEVLLAYFFSLFRQELLGHWVQVKLVQDILRAVLGAEVSNQMGPTIFVSLAWVHPVVLALVFAQAMILCSRVPAGEVDRGTADILLSMPISRWQIHFHEAAMWIGTGALIISMGAIGCYWGNHVAAENLGPPISRVIVVAINLLCLYIAVGGLTCLFSSLSDRRGAAVAVTFAVLLVTLLINLLAPVSKLVERIWWVSLMDYYRPVEIFAGTDWPERNMLILLGVGGLLWIAAGVIFSRRDICTV